MRERDVWPVTVDSVAWFWMLDTKFVKISNPSWSVPKRPVQAFLGTGGKDGDCGLEINVGEVVGRELEADGGGVVVLDCVRCPTSEVATLAEKGDDCIPTAAEVDKVLRILGKAGQNVLLAESFKNTVLHFLKQRTNSCRPNTQNKTTLTWRDSAVFKRMRVMASLNLVGSDNSVITNLSR